MQTNNHTELLLKLRASKARVEKYKKQLAEETIAQQSLLHALQAALGEEIGQPVSFGRVHPITTITARPLALVYSTNRSVIVERIVELRKMSMPFDQIASTLNNEGFVPKTADKFTVGTVYRMFRTSAVPV